jgi:hypothetical protein
MGFVNADNRETMTKARTCCRGVGPSSGSAGDGDIQHFPQHPLTNKPMSWCFKPVRDRQYLRDLRITQDEVDYSNYSRATFVPFCGDRKSTNKIV